MDNQDIKRMDENDTLPFNYPTQSPKIIKVIGVGGGGGNAVKSMYRQGIHDVAFVLANTDRQAMMNSDIPIKLQLGKSVTDGLGAGNNPEIARQAAEESSEDIRALFKDETKMVFITAGMGGGTGTGAAPVVARIAREEGMLTVGIVTIPFMFEMRPKIQQALEGVRLMAGNVDALLVICNEKLLEVYPKLSVKDAFFKVDETLTVATKSVAELITCRGVINVDFRDVKKILENGGIAIMSTGKASGEGRVQQAFNAALKSPLLYNNNIFSAKKLLFNVYQSSKKEYQLEMSEMNEVRYFMDQFENRNIEVIWGLADDDTLEDEVKMTVLATGFGMGDLPIGEVGTDKVIHSIYGRKVDKKATYLIDLSDADLENEELISAIENSPTYSRDTARQRAINALKKRWG